jgi:hypothetical protein
MIENQHSGSFYAMFILFIAIAVGLTLTIVPSTHYQSVLAQSINPRPLETFSASGVIGSMILNNSTKGPFNMSSSQNPYILVGNWTMDVSNKKITDFNANFTMVRADGSYRHTHEFTNFKRVSAIPVILDPKGITFIGMMDIKLNGGNKWFGVPITVSIGKQFNTISITPNSKYTDNHFMGQPIRGVFSSLIDQAGTQLMVSKPTA